jgi:UDP-N-acetylglucosamine diphosphorylase / glucose-1-phosphate thymidylyltransferase / UDP-N-acetylgalactosamine diphosphorylase / glucosamine-1-phosphate N-acetyltransferase / galactosamine-1-phosphate N-acetyltransferase
MILINNYIASFTSFIDQGEKEPWQIVQSIPDIVNEFILQLDKEFNIKDGIAIHTTAVVEANVVIKAPAIVGAHCFIGANAYLRGGVLLTEAVKIGTSCEVKTSIIFDNSSVAHFNFIGDSIIGSHVNFEAGSITANHYNEKTDKNISVRYLSRLINTYVTKFGSLVGDGCKIGANAVLSPGTLLPKNSIVNRLELIDQTLG